MQSRKKRWHKFFPQGNGSCALLYVGECSFSKMVSFTERMKPNCKERIINILSSLTNKLLPHYVDLGCHSQHFPLLSQHSHQPTEAFQSLPK